MSDFAVEVVRLEIEEHPNADRLEIARIGDYNAIVVKSAFKTGDLAAYIPEQSIMPDWLIHEMGLEGRLAGSKKNRVKACRLRQVFSQGLIYPARVHWNEGDDVAEELGIVKYEPAIPSNMRGKLYTPKSRGPHGDKLINFDIENIKKWNNIIQEGEEVVFTEKIHGCADRDTIIETLEYGNKTIGDVVDANLACHVKSLDVDTNEITYEKIIHYSAQDNTNDWYEIKLENDICIKLTGNHLVWLPEYQCYRAVKDLVGNETVLHDKCKVKFSSTHYVTPKEYVSVMKQK